MPPCLYDCIPPFTFISHHSSSLLHPPSVHPSLLILHIQLEANVTSLTAHTEFVRWPWHLAVHCPLVAVCTDCLLQFIFKESFSPRVNTHLHTLRANMAHRTVEKLTSSSKIYCIPVTSDALIKTDPTEVAAPYIYKYTNFMIIIRKG